MKDGVSMNKLPKIASLSLCVAMGIYPVCALIARIFGYDFRIFSEAVWFLLLLAGTVLCFLLLRKSEQSFAWCGLLPIFDKVIASTKTAQSLDNEFKGKNGLREENPLHRPYIYICKLLTSYEPVDSSKLVPMWQNVEKLNAPLTQIGFFDFEELHFEVYEGKGGHLPGEIVLIDYAKHIAITGDVYINMRGLTAEQAEHNQFAPILMKYVDSDQKLCAEERKAILDRLGVGKWQIFGAHGFKKDYSVNS